MIHVSQSSPTIAGSDGQPLPAGNLWVGTAGASDAKASQIAVYWDDAGAQPVTQPVPIVDGRPWHNNAPAEVFCAGDYSLLVEDRYGTVVHRSRHSQVALPIGSQVQGHHATLDAMTAISPVAADTFPYFPSPGSAAGTPITAFGRQILTAADSAEFAALAGITEAGGGAQPASTVLTALAATTPAADKIHYWTSDIAASTADLSTYMRGMLGTADAATLQQSAGVMVGVDVQPFDQNLVDLGVAFTAADTAGGVDEAGDPLPLAGYLHRNEAGELAVQPVPTLAQADVDASINAALAEYARTQDLDDYVTATEGWLRFMPAFAQSAFGAALAAAADAEASRKLLQVQGTDDIRFDLPFLVTSYSPLVGGALGTGGSAATGTGEAGHIGVIDIKSGTVSGSGYKVYCHNKLMLISGGESLRAIVKFPSFTGLTFLFGFTSAGTATEPGDGAYFWLSGSGVVTPKTANNSTRTSGSTVTLSVATWYHLSIDVAAAASSVTFRVHNDAGAELLSQTLSTNIPTTATHECGPALMAVSTDTTGTLVIATADHFNGYLPLN